MSAPPKTLKLCSCNGTIPLDPEALAQALSAKEPPETHRALCRRELAGFSAALGDPAVLVCCTQEAERFKEVAQREQARAKLEFVNIRETAGWARDKKAAGPAIAALIAGALEAGTEDTADDPDKVSYRSGGRLAIVGPAGPSLGWADRLNGPLQVSVLITELDGTELPAEHRYPVYIGQAASLRGHLGAFELAWTSDNPIDLQRCVRCGACVRACPEAAIDFTYQVDRARCKDHRACVVACGEVAAVDFGRGPVETREEFDLVFDLSRQPLLRIAQPPSGYAAPGSDPLDQAESARTLAQWVGEFEKPRYFAYRTALCAHGRSGKTGCTKCLDTCSTGAITAAGDGVRIDPYLCMGCGGCATVCPTGAVTHTVPGVPELAARVRRMAEVYRAAGGGAPRLLVHNGIEGPALIAALARYGGGLPGGVLPFECHHVAAIGLDVMLSALAYGVAGVVFLMGGDDAVQYGEALQREAAVGNAIASGLGYGERCFSVLRAQDWRTLLSGLSGDPPTVAAHHPAAFAGSPDKRTTLRLALDHLVRHAPRKQAAIALPAGAPFGALEIDRAACTLCKACIGVCPASALIDFQDAPRLQFIEANCVQCGLCVNTCPEDALALRPRLLLDESVRQPVVLAEDEVFHCVRCARPFGSRRMIERMTGRIGTHPMFAEGAAGRRLMMCADCRVLDMIENKNEMSIFDVRKR